MITDALLQVSSDQVVTATAVSEDKIDLGVARDIGEGHPLFALFTVKVAVAAAGAATVTFEIITASDAALTSDIEVIGTSGAIAKADLPAGKQLAIRINPQIAALGQRYLGVRYTIATGPLTTGSAFDCDFVETIQDGLKFYASGYTVTE